MSPYPILGPKDREIAREAWGVLMGLSTRSTHPKLKASLASWGMMLRETLKEKLQI